MSLSTAELAEANAKAKLLHAEWEAKFAELRGQPVRAPQVHVQGPALELPKVFAPPGWAAPVATGELLKAKSRRGDVG